MSGWVFVLETEEAQAGLLNLAQVLGDLSEPLALIGEQFLKDTEGRYGAEASPEGNRWMPLAPMTIAEKKGPQSLIESGAMKGSLHVLLPNPYMVEMGYSDSIPYAAVHQFGGFVSTGTGHARDIKRKLKKAGQRTHFVPARPTLGITEANALVAKGILVDWLRRVMSSH